MLVEIVMLNFRDFRDASVRVFRDACVFFLMPAFVRDFRDASLRVFRDACVRS